MPSQHSSPKVLAVIPARFGSTRFPGKPLSLIQGKSLIQRTYENATRCRRLDEVIIATDDQRIFDHVSAFGAPVVMTDPSHTNGTERIGEVVAQLNSPPDIIVNIQGDEPCVAPEVIEALVNALVLHPDVPVSTVITRLDTIENLSNPSVVKCVIAQNGRALYFSRQMIPGNKALQPNPAVSYYTHIGLYAYRTPFLFTYLKLPSTPLQIAEDLEQLKILEHGYPIQTAMVQQHALGVDTPEDIQKVENYLCNQNRQNIYS